jgi:hypothetical protein
MNNKANRVARFTSSKISVLTVLGNGEFGFGAGAITYIKDKIKELQLGRGLTLQVYKKEMIWGKCWEVYIHWQLGLEYKLIIDKTTIHPKYTFWSGSEDFQVEVDGGCISELKCYQLSNHYDYVKCLQKGNIEDFKKEYKDEYWQIVSNSIIHNTKFGEAIAFMPSELDLIEMRRLLEETDYVEKHLKDDPWKYRFIYEEDLYNLAFIPEHSDFPSMVKFRFVVPIEDKIFLTKQVINADKLLNKMLKDE